MEGADIGFRSDPGAHVPCPVDPTPRFSHSLVALPVSRKGKKHKARIALTISTSLAVSDLKLLTSTFPNRASFSFHLFHVFSFCHLFILQLATSHNQDHVLRAIPTHQSPSGEDPVRTTELPC